MTASQWTRTLDVGFKPPTRGGKEPNSRGPPLRMACNKAELWETWAEMDDVGFEGAHGLALQILGHFGLIWTS